MSKSMSPERRALLEARNEARKQAYFAREKLAKCIQFYDRAVFIPVQTDIATIN
jgi:hypothetical protein